VSAPAPGLASFQAELRRYLQDKNELFSSQINEVVADVIRFSSASLHDGFRMALTRLTTDAKVWPNRSFIQLCEAIVEHHIRDIKAGERELVGKSLFEAYIHFAGPEHVFEPRHKTRFMRSLRRYGAKGLAALFLSLHLFNVVCREIGDDVACKMPDQQSYELYMFRVEAMCRDIVARAMELPDDELDARWAAGIVRAIEAQLFQIS
jgi:hypothetical protein